MLGGAWWCSSARRCSACLYRAGQGGEGQALLAGPGSLAILVTKPPGARDRACTHDEYKYNQGRAGTVVAGLAGASHGPAV